MTVYKPLVGGGYASRPVDSPVTLKRLIAQGWSETPPVETAAAPAAVDEAIEDAPAAPTPRGRRKATVN